MGIESNEEAYKTMRNSIGSMENRMREIYNKGYKDGIEEGINRAMQKIAASILEEVEAEPQTDNGIGCSRCESRHDCYDRDMPNAAYFCNNYGKVTDEPKMERSE